VLVNTGTLPQPPRSDVRFTPESGHSLIAAWRKRSVLFLSAKNESFEFVVLSRNASSILGKCEDVSQGIRVGTITHHPRREHISNPIEHELVGCTRR
jgi:hypothetical protein